MALFFAAASAGSKMAANMAIIAMTTNSSIRVNAARLATQMEGGSFSNVSSVFKLAFMDLFSAFYQDDRHVFVDCKLLPDRCSEKLHHLLPATNVSVH